MARSIAALACLAALAACTPEMPDKDKPVEPKSAVRHDDLRRAIDAPLNRARSAQAAVDASAKAQADAIDAAEKSDAAN